MLLGQRLQRLRRRGLATLLWLGVNLYLIASLLFFLRGINAFAATSAVGGSSGLSYALGGQNPQWVAEKLAHRITRPTRAGETIAAPACHSPCATYPAVYSLDTSVVQATLEPGSTGTDAAGHAYYDPNMPRLCGPGAAANALFFWGGVGQWPKPTAWTDAANGITTAWSDQDSRASIMYLAWKTQPPGWPHAGMMDDHHLSSGVTLYNMRDALNWEASHENQDNWKDYFYTVVWWNQADPEIFHADVQDDLANAHVPVVAEVNARLLPTWSPDGPAVNHFITIVGYDDTAHVYYYTDTCGHSTGCGSTSDGGVHPIAQGVLWAAITAVHVNTSSAYNAGDGGFVW